MTCPINDGLQLLGLLCFEEPTLDRQGEVLVDGNGKRRKQAGTMIPHDIFEKHLLLGDNWRRLKCKYG